MRIASPARWLSSPFPPALKLPHLDLQADKKPFRSPGAFRMMYKRQILLLSLSCRNMRSPTGLLSFFLPSVTLQIVFLSISLMAFIRQAFDLWTIYTSSHKITSADDLSYPTNGRSVSHICQFATEDPMDFNGRNKYLF